MEPAPETHGVRRGREIRLCRQRQRCRQSAGDGATSQKSGNRYVIHRPRPQLTQSGTHFPEIFLRIRRKFRMDRPGRKRHDRRPGNRSRRSRHVFRVFATAQNFVIPPAFPQPGCQIGRVAAFPLVVVRLERGDDFKQPGQRRQISDQFQKSFPCAVLRLFERVGVPELGKAGFRRGSTPRGGRSKSLRVRCPARPHVSRGTPPSPGAPEVSGKGGRGDSFLLFLYTL